MKKLFVLLLLLLFAQAAGAQNKPLWQFGYNKADKEGQLSICSAYVEFSNSMFSARLHGENLDFFYYRDDFTLPYDEFLGKLIFRIDSVAFLLDAYTVEKENTDITKTSRFMLIYPRKEDFADLYNALKSGVDFDVEFPNGDVYEFGLRGSRAALNAASECWKSRPTGPFSNNPFYTSSKTNNPFETL